MMDYGKFKYEQSVKAREARKKQTRTVIKEVQFRPKIGESDFEVKRRRVERFLDEGDKVKCTMRFRGREVTHPEIGRAILQRLFEEVEEMAVIETNPRLDGRQMTMVLAPAKRTRKETTEDSPEQDTSVQDISPEAGSPEHSSPEDSSPEDNRTDVPAAAAAADTLGDEAGRGGHVPE
jgi:translation initiation factor IF-3